MSTYTGTPVRAPHETSLDLIGEMINLYRLPGESLADFKGRLIDWGANRSNSSYGGLVNGVNRELGLDAQTKGILIDVVRDSDGYAVDTNLGLEINSKNLVLYSNHVDGTVQSTYDLHSRGSYYFLGDLLTYLNLTSNFEAVAVNTDTYDKSSHLEMISSKVTRNQQPLRTRTRLHHLTSLSSGNFVTGTLKFNANISLNTEVTTTPDNEGEFMVDYDNGVVWTYELAEGRVTYAYQRFPLFIRLSPVSIFAFKHDGLLDRITEQIVDDDGTTIDGIPTIEGADMINELLAVTPMTWGE